MTPDPRTPADANLPHLATVASETAMSALFAAHLEDGWSLERCHVRKRQYYPGHTCLLAYRIRCRSESDETTTLTLHARAFGPGEVPSAFRSRPPLATAVGRLPSFLPQISLALWMFPDDPGILGLADVWRRGGTTFDRKGVLVHVPWSGRRPTLDPAIVGYIPTKRCILRYDGPDHEGLESFYGKVYAGEDAALLFAQSLDLWSYSQESAPELGVARPLGCDRGLNVVWQASPGGARFFEILDEMDLEGVMRRVAAALAALHRSALRPTQVWRVQDETVKLERARATLRRFYPMLEGEIDTILGDLVKSAPPEATRLVPVHGDFHCNQVLVDKERIAILDFDRFGLGDPMYDIARFISRFRAYTRERMASGDVALALASFLSTYEILVPWTVDRRRLSWMTATLLVNRQTLKSIKKLDPDDPEPVSDLLGLARDLAGERDLV